MSDDISPADAARHDEIVDKAWSLVEGEVFLDRSGPSGRPGMFARRRLQKAIERFQEALEINITGWQSMWALGKIHQRLESAAESLFWFRKAMAIAPDQPDVARETGLAAFEVGKRGARAPVQPGRPGRPSRRPWTHGEPGFGPSSGRRPRRGRGLREQVAGAGS